MVNTEPVRKNRIFRDRKKTTLIKCTAAYIVLIVTIFISLLPILWILSTSLDSVNNLASTSLGLFPEQFTLDNYKELIAGKNSHFLTWLLNSTFVALVTTVCSLVIGITAAYACSRFKFRGRKAFLNLFLLLNAFPNILSIIAYYKMLSIFDMVDSLGGLIFIYAGGQLVFIVWNLKGHFDAIPYEIEEAAFIDGAGPFNIFVRIVLPLSKPAIAVASLFVFLAAWNEYIFAMTFLSDRDKFTLPVALWSLQNAGDYAQNWPLFAAGSIVIALPVVLVFLLLQRNLKSGLTMGSLK